MLCMRDVNNEIFFNKIPRLVKKKNAKHTSLLERIITFEKNQLTITGPRHSIGEICKGFVFFRSCFTYVGVMITS